MSEAKDSTQDGQDDQFDKVLERLQTDREEHSDNPEYIQSLAKYEKAVLILREHFFDASLNKIREDRRQFPLDKRLAKQEKILITLKQINSGLVKEKMDLQDDVDKHVVEKTRVMLGKRDVRERNLEDKVRERDEKIKELKHHLDSQQEKTLRQAEKASLAEANLQKLKEDTMVLDHLGEILKMREEFLEVFRGSPEFVTATLLKQGIEPYMADPGRTEMFDQGEAFWWGKMKDALTRRQDMDFAETRLTSQAGSAEERASINSEIVDMLFGADFYDKVKTIFDTTKKDERWDAIRGFVSKEFQKNYTPLAHLLDERKKKEVAEELIKKTADDLNQKRGFYEAVSQILPPAVLEKFETEIAKASEGEAENGQLIFAISKAFTKAVSAKDADMIQAYKSILKSIMPAVYEKVREIQDPKELAKKTVGIYKLGLKKKLTEAIKTQTTEIEASQLEIVKRNSELENIVLDLQKELAEEREESAVLQEENKDLKELLELKKSTEGDEAKYKAQFIELWSKLPPDVVGILGNIMGKKTDAAGKTEEISYEQLKSAFEQVISEREDFKQQAEGKSGSEKDLKQKLVELWSMIPDDVTGVLVKFWGKEQSAEGKTEEVSYDQLKDGFEKIVKQRADYQQKAEDGEQTITKLRGDQQKLIKEHGDEITVKDTKSMLDDETIRNLRADAEVNADKIKRYEERQEALEARLTEKRTEIEELNAQKEAWQNTAEDHNQQTTVHIEELERQVRETQTELNDLKESKSELVEKLREQSVKLADQVKVIEEAEETASSSQLEVGRLKKKVKELSGMDLTDFVTKEMYESDILAKDETILARDQEIIGLKKSAEGSVSEEELKQILSEREETVKERYQTVIAEKKDALEGKESELSDVRAELTSKKELIVEKKSELEAAKANAFDPDKHVTKSQYEADIDAKEQEIEDLSAQKSDLEARIQGKCEELRDAEQELADKEMEIKERDAKLTENADAEWKLSEKEAELEEAKKNQFDPTKHMPIEEYKRLEKEADTLEERNKSLLEKCEQYKLDTTGTISTQKMTITQLEQDREDLSRQLELLEQDLRTAQSGKVDPDNYVLKSDHEEKVKGLEDTIHAKDTELEQKEKDIETSKKKEFDPKQHFTKDQQDKAIQSAAADLKKKVTELETEKADIHKEYTEYKAKVMPELEENQKKLEGLVKETSELQARIDAAEKDLEAAKKNAFDPDKHVKKDQYEAGIKSKDEAHKKDKARLETEVTGLTDQLADAEKGKFDPAKHVPKPQYDADLQAKQTELEAQVKLAAKYKTGVIKVRTALVEALGGKENYKACMAIEKKADRQKYVSEKVQELYGGKVDEAVHQRLLEDLDFAEDQLADVQTRYTTVLEELKAIKQPPKGDK